MGDQQEQKAEENAVFSKSSPQRSRRRTLRLLGEACFGGLLAATIVMFFYQPMGVDGGSMEPTLIDRERIFVNRVWLGKGSLRRGDIVVFYAPSEQHRSYVKRVAALGGDCVQMRQGYLFVNGAAVVEDYVAPEDRDNRSTPRVCVPADEIYVLGDHRNRSNDSRNFGPIPLSSLYGRAVFAYWPLRRFGKLR